MRRLLVDLDRCIGCGACATACARVLGGTSAIRYAELGRAVEIPSVCRHCTEAPCLNVCPSEAITQHPKRFKVIDQDKCIKCGNCLEVCPEEYGAVIKLSPVSKVPGQVEK